MIPFMENAKILDVLPLKDMISIYSDIHYFFGDESYEDEIKIYTFLCDSLHSYVVNNNCELINESDEMKILRFQLIIHDIITEERNQLFYQYSQLFDFFNITIVTLKCSYYSSQIDIPINSSHTDYGNSIKNINIVIMRNNILEVHIVKDNHGNNKEDEIIQKEMISIDINNDFQTINNDDKPDYCILLCIL
ncbi:hypothetical protein WA158_006359 [Blastocystis sp. Blastoise]